MENPNQDYSIKWVIRISDGFQTYEYTVFGTENKSIRDVVEAAAKILTDREVPEGKLIENQNND
jgi:hypothetical protein